MKMRQLKKILKKGHPFWIRNEPGPWKVPLLIKVQRITLHLACNPPIPPIRGYRTWAWPPLPKSCAPNPNYIHTY